MHWLKEGDQNSKYFFKCVNGRRNVNSIHEVHLKDDSFTFDKVLVKEEFINDFKRAFNNGYKSLVDEKIMNEIIKFWISLKLATFLV